MIGAALVWFAVIAIGTALLAINDRTLDACRTFAKKQARAGQQSYASYIHICTELANAHRPLVFGLGYDSKIYLGMNNSTVFVEDNATWIERVNLQCLHCVVQYTYKTDLADGVLDDADIPPLDAPQLLQQQFDMILIDAPLGMHTGAPGRSQPIKFAAAQRDAGHLRYVCLHDAHRHLEHTLFLRYFGAPDDVLSKGFARQQLACKQTN